MINTDKLIICMVSDSHFITQTKVAIWTMRKSTPSDTNLEVNIICSSEFEQKLRKETISWAEKIENVNVIFREINVEIFKGAVTTGDIPMVSYYRLVIPDILESDKCLFLDGDIIVNRDLNDIYNNDMEDLYVAAVKDMGFVYDEELAKKHKERSGFESLDTYVNAGVMLFNLSKIREAGLKKRLLMEVSKGYIYMDQDIMNHVFYGKMKLLPSHFNEMRSAVALLKKRDKLYKDDFDNKIVHFSAVTKPWNNIRISGSDMWWSCAKEALDEKEYADLYNEAVELTNKTDWSYIMKRCNCAKDIVVVGCGKVGKMVYDALVRCGVRANIITCDNSPQKQIEGAYSVECAAENFRDALWINAVWTAKKEINAQLLRCGISPENIVTYYYKNEYYYYNLEKRFEEHEKRELAYMNSGRM